MSLGFTKSKVDFNLYHKVVDGGQVILLLYVDDLFLTGEEKIIFSCKKKVVVEFKMKDLGMMHYFLGLEVWQNLDKIVLRQGKYTMEILKIFRMMDCKPMTMLMMMNLKLLSDYSSKIVDTTLYKKMIGSLMYLMKMRPNICFAVNTLSQYMVKPRRVHLNATRHVLRYLKGIATYGIQYVLDCEFKPPSYTDLDWVDSFIDRRSTSRC